MINDLTITRKTLLSGSTEVVFDNLSITTDSVFEFYASVYGISPATVVVNTDNVTTTWESQTSDIEVGIRVM